jgi:hypothetical protein
MLARDCLLGRIGARTEDKVGCDWDIGIPTALSAL